MRGINDNTKFVEFLHVAECVQVRRFHNTLVIMFEFQAVGLVIICLVCDVLNLSIHTSADVTLHVWFIQRISLLLLLLLLIKRYNLYKALSCSTTSFQLCLFCATFFQLLMFMLFISSKTSSSHRVLGLPIGLLDMGFHLLIFCILLSSAMRSTWPN